jgi:hypothetical protein
VEQLQARVTELEGRVKALEAALQTAEAQLKDARLKNGQFVLEVGRLRKLCETAGIPPDEKPKVAAKPPATPLDRIDPQVRAYLESARKRWNGHISQSGNPGELTWPLATGKVGTFSPYFQCVVEQVIDGSNILVRTAFAGDSDAEGLKMFWVSGCPTADLVNGQHIKAPGVFRVKGTRQYSTTAGSTNTVFELEPFDVDAYLARVASEQAAKPVAPVDNAAAPPQK